jgi:hypothetical protein
MITKWFTIAYATYTCNECQFGWKWNIHLYHPILMASQNRWKCNFYDLKGGSKAIEHHVASF